MKCPACAAPMTALTLAGQVGTSLDIDLCSACQVLWFDRHESTRLTPASVLRLFETIGQGRERSRTLPAEMRCPRCDLRLLTTHDRQRNTPFQYWRCAREHGRLITFFDFLREKDFVKPLSAAQIAELRQNVQMVNCSNCGAPIDLAQSSACSHCATPIAMLDIAQIRRMAEELQQASSKRAQPDPSLPLRLEMEKREVEALFASLRAGQSRGSTSFSLVDAGLEIISSWFKR